MSAELLERATRALRIGAERTSSATRDAQLERALARLERAERARPRAPRLLRTAGWTLAATLACAGAWAHATGRVSWFASVMEPAGTEPATAAGTAPRAAARSAPASEPAQVLPGAAPVLVPPLPEALPEVEPRPETAPPVIAPQPQARPRPAPQPAPKESQRALADELYREAHAAHFTRGDYAAALAAWDRYLSAAGPAHRWTVEARFNRGVALYRLGQKEAARRALRPFAEGEYGSYRRDEAGRLLEALRGAP
ncbi:MAG: hypothetical protein RL685_2103 [Pseudomonadota bacterium]|jgi:tetratricopeptide (TPR) repeat protein